MSQNASDTTAARLFLRTVSQWFIMQKQASQAKAGRLEAAAVMTSVRVEQIQRSLAGLRAAPAVRFREGRQESAQHGSSRPVAPAPVSARQGPGVFLRTVGYTIPQYTVTSALTFASAMRHSAAGINGMYDASGRISEKFAAMRASVLGLGRVLPLAHEQLAKLFKTGNALGLTGVNSLRDFAATAATLSFATGMEPDAAAAAVENFIRKAGAGSKATREQQLAFSELGLSAEDMAARLQKNGPEALTELFERIRLMPAERQGAILEGIAGGPELAASILPLAGMLDKLKSNLRQSAEAARQLAPGQQAAAEGARAAGEAFALFANQSRELAVSVGTAVLPPLIFFANALTPILSSVTSLINEHQTLTAGLLGIVSGLALLHTAGAGVNRFFSSLKKGWHVLGTTLGFLVRGMKTVAAASGVARIAALRSAAAWGLHRAVLLAGAAASRTAAAGAWLLNAAFTANPIGIVVMGIAALVGGLVWLYRTCEPVRAAFDAVFGFIGEKFGWVAEKIRTVQGWFGSPAADIAAAINEEAGSRENAAVSSTSAPVAPPPMPVPPQPWNPDEVMSPEAAGMAFPSGPGGMDASGMAALAGAGGGPMSFQLNVSLNGMTDADFGRRVMDGLKRRQGELEKLIAGIVDEQRRLAYG